MLKVQSLRTFAISGHDITASEKFYTKVLGATVARRIEPNPEELAKGAFGEVDFQVGNFQVHVFDTSEKPRQGVPHHTLNFTYQDKEQSLRDLEELGASIQGVREHHGGKGYSLYVLDPDGNRWELSFDP